MDVCFSAVYIQACLSFHYWSKIHSMKLRLTFCLVNLACSIIIFLWQIQASFILELYKNYTSVEFKNHNSITICRRTYRLFLPKGDNFIVSLPNLAKGVNKSDFIGSAEWSICKLQSKKSGNFSLCTSGRVKNLDTR
jgi:hypothetical protein